MPARAWFRSAVLVFCCLCGAHVAADQPRGLWLMPRKDSCNTARADIAGNMKTAPRVLWSYGSPSTDFRYLRAVHVYGRPAYLAQVQSGLGLITPDGKIVWKRPVMGIGTVVDVSDDASGRPLALATLQTRGFCLVDVVTGRTLWTWETPAGSYLGGYQVLREPRRMRLVVFPQNSMIGFCFEIGRRPRLLWQHDYTGRYWKNFGPFFVLADMDNDGRPEIVLVGKPGYAGVIDSDNGTIKFDLQYQVAGGAETGRPYGLITAVDIDGDGWRDIVVASCQVEEYTSVIHNDGGKHLSLVWSRYIGADYPTEPVKLRPNTTSVADVNGDGRKELVLGLFNESGDGRWHTLVIDPLKGWQDRLIDLPDRYFWGCCDLSNDGRPEILTSIEKSGTVTEPKGLQAVDGRSGKDIAVVENASLSFVNTRLPRETSYHAAVTTPSCLALKNGAKGLFVAKDGRDCLWRITDGKSRFKPLRMTPVSRGVMSSEGSGTIGRLDLSIGPAAKAGAVSASGPLVAESDGRRELILSLSNGTVIGGTPDLARPGVLTDSWTIPGSMPSVWMGPDGKRLVCVADPTKDIVSVYEPTGGSSAKPICSFRTRMPVNRPSLTRTTAELVPFGERDMNLFVGLRPGTHAIAGACYDIHGDMLWHDDEDGPYPRIAAAADLNGDGNDELVLDNHGREIIYDAKGSGTMVAVGWNTTVPGRGDGAKYSFPIVGPFGPGGATRIVMSGGLDALETLDAAGTRVAKSPPFANTYDFEWCGAAVAKIGKTQDWDLGMVNCYGVFYCSDANTCRTRWTFDLGVKPVDGISISSGDVDGDGCDEFLVGLPDGRLVALAEIGGKGHVLWTVTFDAGVREALLADVDGDGRGEIIADLEDGTVKVLK